MAQLARANSTPGLQQYQANPGVWFGPAYAGAALDFFFIGILCHQVSAYYLAFPTDSRLKKGLVAHCFCLSIFKGVVSCLAIWEDISGFGDWRRAMAVTWTTYISPVSMIFLSFSAQTYFAWRCFILTERSWPLLIFLGTTMLGSLALGIALTWQLSYNPTDIQRIESLVFPLFILNLALDILITSTVWYKLAQARRGTNRTRKAFVDKWIAITFECALPPTVSHTSSVIAFAGLSQKGAYYNIFSMLTPRLYVFSLMYTLNSRRPIQYVPETITLSTKPTTSAIKGEEKNTVLTLSAFKAPDQLDAQMSGLESWAPRRPRATSQLSWDFQQTSSNY